MLETIRAFATTIVSFLLAFLFLAIALYTVKRTSPAQFYPWMKINPEMLENVYAYNCEMCNMWLSCFFVFVIVGLAGLINVKTQAVSYLLCLFPGGLFLNKRYKRILRHSLKADYIEKKDS